jgi:cytidylate kinase
MKRKNRVIAIDGPAGAGKSTIAKEVARSLNYRYIDTGAMYRAVAWKALNRGISLEAPESLTRLAKNTRIRFSQENGALRVFVDGEDVAHRIRTQKTTRATSVLAAIKGVRRVLRQRQREMGRQGGIVMEGRDIGTAVFPDADFKFYLDASPLERARRRYKELRAKNKRVSLQAIADAIRRRDQRDRARGASPLKAAPDAVVVDTTDLSQHEVSKLILQWVAKKRPLSAERS